MQKHFFFQNVIICVGKVPKKKQKQIHVYTQSMLLYVYLYSKFYFSTSEWENSDISFLNVRRKNKYYLFAHFTEFWSEIVFNN